MVISFSYGIYPLSLKRSPLSLEGLMTSFEKGVNVKGINPNYKSNGSTLFCKRSKSLFRQGFTPFVKGSSPLLLEGFTPFAKVVCPFMQNGLDIITCSSKLDRGVIRFKSDPRVCHCSGQAINLFYFIKSF